MKKYYLAYGSNLSVEQMAHRCPDAVYVGTAVINGYQLLFKGSSSGNYLTIEKKRGRQVPVLVWQISESDEASLDMYEGFPRFYYKSMMPVEVHSLLDGKALGVVDALIYIMHEERLKGCPTSRYFDVCLGGYTRFGFPAEKLFKAVTDSVGKRTADRFLAAYRDAMPEQQMA